MAAGKDSQPNVVENSSSDRIKQLNDIDRNVITLLHSAGSAVKALTDHVDTASDQSPSQSLSIQQQKASFIAATSQYFSLLSSIDVNLRRQIYALEEANIVSADSTSKDSQTSLTAPAAFTAMSGGPISSDRSKPGAEKVTNQGGGLGNLDVGWLNSRNDKVGKEMELALWASARGLVETMEIQGAKEKEDDDIDMEHEEVATMSTN